MTRPFIPETRLLIDLFGISNTIQALGGRDRANPQDTKRILEKTSTMLNEFQKAQDYLATPLDRFMIEPERVVTIQRFSPEFRELLPERLTQTQSTIDQIQTGESIDDKEAEETQDFFRDLFEHMFAQLD